MPIHPPQGDLARTLTHEADESWPDHIEIVAYWRPDKRGKRRAVEISADQFFGRGGHGAPMSGDQLVAAVQRLRKG